MKLFQVAFPSSVAIALVFMVSNPALATIVLQDWQFNDPNGTNLSAVANTGTLGTAFNFGGPSTQNGNLNLGDPTFFKWDVGTGQTFRTASFADLTSGQYVFEFVIADWNFGGSVGETNNGIKFNFGDSTLGSAQLEFEVAQSPGNDIRVRSQNSNNGNLSGTDAQNQLGGLDLTNTNSVTVQLLADLDTGIWTTQVDAGSDGSFVDLVTDGTGMNSIDRIQLIIEGGANGWDFGGVQGTAGDFVKIDSITLTQVMPIPEPSGILMVGSVAIGCSLRRRRR
ncbi:MAG: PEP-CTERM sorting domain-containing protein [Planctomycetota bacterium]